MDSKRQSGAKCARRNFKNQEATVRHEKYKARRRCGRKKEIQKGQIRGRISTIKTAIIFPLAAIIFTHFALLAVIVPILVSVCEFDGVGINATGCDNQLHGELTTKARDRDRVARHDGAQGVTDDHRVDVFELHVECIGVFAWVRFRVLNDVQPAPSGLVLWRAGSTQIVLETFISEDSSFLLRARVGFAVLGQGIESFLQSSAAST